MRQRIILAIALFATVLVLGACTTPTGEVISEPDGTLKFGAIMQLSGLGAEWSENAVRGAELALEEINEVGGVNGKHLDLDIEVNQAYQPQTTVDAYRTLRARDRNIFIGPSWSTSGLAVAPIVCSEGTVMISPSLGVADFNEECDTIFNLWPHDVASSADLAKYVLSQGHERIAIVGSLQIWEHTQATVMKEFVEAAGKSVVAFELAEQDETGFRTEVAKIVNTQPDAIVLTNQAHMHLTTKRLREVGVTAPIYSVMIDREQIAAADGAFEDVVVISASTPEPWFVEKFEARYGEKPDISADNAYDVMYLLAQAIEATGSEDPRVIAGYLNSLDEYTGASGHMIFDGRGGITKDPRLFVVKNGELVPLES